MAHIKCRYVRECGFEGECDFIEFEKNVKFYELDGYNNLNLKGECISGDEIVYLEIDGRIIKGESTLINSSDIEDYIYRELFCECVFYEGRLWYVDDYDDESIYLIEMVLTKGDFLPGLHEIAVDIKDYKSLKTVQIKWRAE